jgi:hypothetical protein
MRWIWIGVHTHIYALSYLVHKIVLHSVYFMYSLYIYIKTIERDFSSLNLEANIPPSARDSFNHCVHTNAQFSYSLYKHNTLTSEIVCLNHCAVYRCIAYFFFLTTVLCAVHMHIVCLNPCVRCTCALIVLTTVPCIYMRIACLNHCAVFVVVNVTMMKKSL